MIFYCSTHLNPLFEFIFFVFCVFKSYKTQINYFIFRFCSTSVDEFEGVTLEDLLELEKLFQVNVVVYALELQSDEEEQQQPEIVARLVRRSHTQHASTMYLNLYKNHFSYITNMAKYSKSYQCSRCGKYWKDGFMLNRHEKKCEAKVRYRFPGSTYKPSKTILHLLEDEGIAIPEELRFFPYRATFDFECMFDTSGLPHNSTKLTWENKHVPVSVSVCSNVPEYHEPRCFVSDGDCKALVKRMVDYLIEVSQESYRLMKEQFVEVFQAINDKLGAGDSTTDQPLDGSEEEDEGGINVLESDDEDEEEYDSENEEDRAFIDDDDSDDEEDVNFYRAFDRELGDTRVPHSRQEVQQEKKRPHPLVKLKVCIIVICLFILCTFIPFCIVILCINACVPFRLMYVFCLYTQFLVAFLFHSHIFIFLYFLYFYCILFHLIINFIFFHL